MELGNNNLPQLRKRSVKELMKIKGIGEAKTVTIVTALKLGRRRHGASSLMKDCFRKNYLLR
jgi:DNA repair protein RadC